MTRNSPIRHRKASNSNRAALRPTDCDLDQDQKAPITDRDIVVEVLAPELDYRRAFAGNRPWKSGIREESIPDAACRFDLGQ